MEVKKKATVTVIVPVYNVEKYINRCLLSIAKQTVPESIECIIVDDCGLDNSMQLAERFVADYKGSVSFKIFHNNVNKGLSGARNSGIRIAQGDYLYFLDSDDEIKPDCIESFLKITAKYRGINLIQGLFENDSPYMRQFLTKDIPPYTDDKVKIKSMLLDYDFIPITAANRLIKTSLIRENNIYFKEGIIHEDNHWGFFLAKYVKSFALNRKQGYIYYANPNSIMTSVNLEKEIKAYRVMIEEFCDHIDPFLSGRQKQTIFYLLLGAIKNKYYQSEEDKKVLISSFLKVNNIIERFILSFSLHPSQYLHSFFVRLLSKLYTLEK